MTSWAIAKKAVHVGDDLRDLVRILVSARSKVEANLAFMLLRDSVTDSGLVQIANLREVVAELPAPPFAVPSELGVLGRVLGWEVGQNSVRKAFDCDEGVFGLELAGEGNRVDRVVLHTVHGRTELRGSADDVLDADCAELLLRYSTAAASLAEALVVLGVPFSPRFYMSVNDYILENSAAAAVEFAEAV